MYGINMQNHMFIRYEHGLTGVLEELASNTAAKGRATLMVEISVMNTFISSSLLCQISKLFSTFASCTHLSVGYLVPTNKSWAQVILIIALNLLLNL